MTLAAVVLSTAGCRKASERDAIPIPSELSGLIRTLQASTADWNQGNLDGFVAPYDDSCTFMSRSGPVGKIRMQENYRKTYFKNGHPEQALRFENLSVRPLRSLHALMIGRYVVSGGGQPEHNGWFTLVWTKTDQGWKILHDHSS